MKKNILLVILIGAGFLAHAQTFFSEDFAAGIPLSWTNVDNSGNNVLWRTTTTGSVNTGVSVDTILSPVGTSAANGFLIIDSDSAGQALTEDAVLTTSAINCSAHAIVHLRFNEYFAQYLASYGLVSVSNDNVNWVNVHSADTGLGLNQGTANPNLVEVDVTSIAGGQSTVYIRFMYHGEWDYWWFVDDVEMLEPPAIDLSVSSIEKLNSEYTLIPYIQATALHLSAEVTNVGGNATTGGTALFEIFNGITQVFSENINLPNIAAGATQVIVPATAFVPASSGSYKSKLTLNIAGDANALNDAQESAPILLSDTVYARDDDNFAGTQGIGVGPGEDAITGQNFQVNTADNLTSITFFMDDGFGAQAAGTPVYFTVHPQANDSTGPDGGVVLATSETLLVTPGMIPAGGAYYSLSMQGGPLALTPGLYYIGIHETDSILTIGYSTSIYTPGAVWVHWNSIPAPPAVNGWAHAEDFTVEVAYMIRANFSSNWDAVPRLKNVPELGVYPNPASDRITLRITGVQSEKNYAVSILNVFGQEEFSGRWNGMKEMKIDVAGLNTGLYTLVVRSDETWVTRKILVTH